MDIWKEGRDARKDGRRGYKEGMEEGITVVI
jgi:hypothetical protein